MVNGQPKVLIAFVLLLGSLGALAQTKPRIDFDSLIAALPDLPWEFEIRYVVRSANRADMLRIHADARVNVIRWRPEYPGSLASVCHSTLDDNTIRRLLELLRDKQFNDLPSDNETLKSVALAPDSTISVRLGRTVVQKIDRGKRKNEALQQIESSLDRIKTSVTKESNCEMESVPAKP